MSDRCKIVVVGSLIIDQYARVESFPKPGETVLTDDLEIRFGGKGANQAVAAARLGADVEMIGCVGDDAFGRDYRQRFEEFGIGTSGILSLGEASTGSAFVTLDAKSENSIVVAAGANARLPVDHIEAQAMKIAACEFLILQNEVPAEVNAMAVEIAKRNGVEILYNPAPWRNGSEIDRNDFHLMIVNEIEAASLLGSEIVSAADLPDGVVVTRGAESTLAKFGGEVFEIMPEPVKPIDTVGAGDCFCGALATGMGDTRLSFSNRLEFANLAAGMSTLKVGAQEAVPLLSEMP